MKHLFFIFLWTGTLGSPQLLAKDVSMETYGKHHFYRYVVEHLVSMDEEWGRLITHCSIVEEDQVIQTYDGLGSCIFRQVDVLSDEERSRKNIIFHAQAEDQVFDLLFQWEGLSVQDIFGSYLDEDPHKLSSQITLDILNEDKSLSESLSYLILYEMFQAVSSRDRIIFQKSSDFLLQKTINVIRLTLVPYAEGLLQVTLSFVDSLNKEFYKLEVVTNYYLGADEYFVTSMDQYQEERGE